MSIKNTQYDYKLRQVVALPNGATSTLSASYDFAKAVHGDAELAIETPEVNITALPNTKTLTAELWGSADNSTFALYGSILLGTGATGAVVAKQSKRWKPASDAPRYFKVKFVNSGTGNASALDATIDFMG